MLRDNDFLQEKRRVLKMPIGERDYDSHVEEILKLLSLIKNK
jgi:hypothetical protein